MGLFGTNRQNQRLPVKSSGIDEMTKLLLFSNSVKFTDSVINSIGDKKLIVVNYSILLQSYISAQASFVLVDDNSFEVLPKRNNISESFTDMLDHCTNKLENADSYLFTQSDFSSLDYFKHSTIKSVFAIRISINEFKGFILIESSIPRYLNDMRSELVSSRDYLVGLLNSSGNYTSIEYLAKRDPLTGLFNRTSLEENSIIAQEGADTLTYVMFDIDYFKKVNDTYGHQSGDLVLKFLSNMFLEIQSKTILPHRYGGEEFLVIFKNYSPKDVTIYVDNLRKKIQSCSVPIVDTSISITISCGLFTTCNIKTPYKQIIEHADTNLYTAKKEGRNRVISTTDIKE